ncbi:hypothetical protein [Microbulbifer sp. YPW16]|uniref:hypothetical protein n=1 Tax=Microbulbifer sp. YPW16 TaxID=2904242 RepID=UPI001E39484A|nr:hypothetical protein [Microbulbifer sp. YPW16]UHQ55858.1 hypothetical protein LVE68_02390 [Microbulbifer sp. YPW16]
MPLSFFKKCPATDFVDRVCDSDSPRALVEEIGNRFSSNSERLSFFIDACNSALKSGGQAFGKVLNLVCAFLISRGDIDSAYSIAFKYEDAGDVAVLPINRSQVMFRRGDVDAAIEYARSINIKCNWTATVASTLLMTYHDWDHLGSRLAEVKRHAREDVYSEISSKFSILTRSNRFESSNASIPVHCINLDRDVHRFMGLEQLYRKVGCDVRRQAGVLGSAVPRLMQQTLFKAELPPNSVGCWSSQVRALEVIVESGHDYGMIVEDDGLPAFHFSFQGLLDALPKDADICFLNDRSVPGWWRVPGQSMKLVNINQAYDDVASDVRAIGADGYLVSRAGAIKILDELARNGAVKHYDWQIYSYGIDAVADGDERHVSKIIRDIRRRSGTCLKLNGYVSTVPFVIHSPMGFNARVHFKG